MAEHPALSILSLVTIFASGLDMICCHVLQMNQSSVLQEDAAKFLLYPACITLTSAHQSVSQCRYMSPELSIPLVSQAVVPAFMMAPLINHIVGMSMNKRAAARV